MLGDPPPAPFDPALLRGAPDLRPLGIDPGRSGWHHVRHGAWVDEAVWRGLTPEQRHAALVHATDLAARRPARNVYALESAAAVWGLPVIGAWPQHVTVLRSREEQRGSAVVRVHVGLPTEGVLREGLRVTEVARTVVDLARIRSFESGLTAADHALRHAMTTPEALVAAAGDVPPRVWGRPRALLVAELADGRSMSPGESLSRARMFTLRLPRPQLQVPLEDDEGFIGLGDFGWPGVVGEFDGRRKYAVPEGADAAAAEQALWAEKLREDRIRRRWRLARWVWADALEEARLARILLAEGVRPVARPRWVDLGARDAS
ncbi:hypothetical protein KMZ32_15150 [Phycicoccus sp. MAQZ13P-2]|uniref:hypothetical protein n=1 Tax=Phycicoccus mangrovi TaxID=2840470 RepID=UPI001C00086B|nr:hypothetical protein [Phycicoccus mangrovi]MBT9257097.1 hypothetical protein [Phycicoccus mangrovi]MBT9275413.1 hypothetical protein [Phycicoccus mangrovi]